MQTLSVLTRKTKTFLKIDNKIKVEFIQAYIYTGIYRAFIIFVPFNKLKKRMGKYKEESPDNASNEEYKIAKRVSWIVRQASKYTPWQSKCLVQALVAQRMLNKRGISSTIYLGVKKEKDNKMLAHAWVRCGKYYVTGGINRQEYIVVAKFSNYILEN